MVATPLSVFFRGVEAATPLYYAAVCGLYDLGQLIIKHPQQVSERSCLKTELKIKGKGLVMYGHGEECASGVQVKGEADTRLMQSASDSPAP